MGNFLLSNDISLPANGTLFTLVWVFRYVILILTLSGCKAKCRV